MVQRSIYLEIKRLYPGWHTSVGLLGKNSQPSKCNTPPTVGVEIDHPDECKRMRRGKSAMKRHPNQGE